MVITMNEIDPTINVSKKCHDCGCSMMPRDDEEPFDGAPEGGYIVIPVECTNPSCKMQECLSIQLS